MAQHRSPTAKAVLASLAHWALVDIRTTAYVGAHVVEIPDLADVARVRMLADMFHNTPNVLANGKARACQDHLDSLWRVDAHRRAWLEGIVAHLRIDRTSPIFRAWSE